jgi:hypothetical protein
MFPRRRRHLAWWGFAVTAIRSQSAQNAALIWWDLSLPLFERGLALQVIDEQLGDRDLQMLIRHYGRSMPGRSSRRRHSSLGYFIPAEFERGNCRRLAA